MSADYMESALREDFSGRVEPEKLGLSQELSELLRGWNERYRRIIPLDMSERRQPELVQEITALDVEGALIAERVREELGLAKIRYFSEGELRYLT